MDRHTVSYHLFLAGLLILSFSLPLSHFGMSISQLFMGIGWLLAGDFRNRISKFLNCRPAVLLVGLYLLHVVGLLWSADMDYAMKDLRIKLPLFILPFMISSFAPIRPDHFRWILYTALTGVLISSLISLGIFLGFGNVQVTNIRDISIFISHIRLSLMVCMGAVIAVYLIRKERVLPGKQALVLFLYLLIAWFVMFLFLLESLTGLIILGLLSGIHVLYLIYNTRNRLAMITTAGFVLVVMAVFILVMKGFVDEVNLKKPVDFASLETHSPSGNIYKHIEEAGTYENGNYIWYYVCEPELREQWNKRSSVDYDGNDLRGQRLHFTLIRYLASKGLRKDSSGVSQLSQDDISLIEGGVANHKYKHSGSITTRLHQLVWELNNYAKGGNPDGHSVVQRIEYWKASAGIIQSSMTAGVGTGDVPDAFDEYYNMTDSWLSEKWRLRSHNQYLSIGVAFGITGILYFIFILLYPVSKAIRGRNLLFLSFLVVACLSMLTEDTLETQAGVTFFTFYWSLFLLIYPGTRETAS